MTPEFDRRSAVVFGSPYWDGVSDAAPPEDHVRRNDEFHELKRAVQKADVYDDLSAGMKELYDVAEIVAKKAMKDWEAGRAERDRLAAEDEAEYWKGHSLI